MKAALIVLGAMAGAAVLAGLGWVLCVIAAARSNEDWDWPESVWPSPAMGQPREDGERRNMP